MISNKGKILYVLYIFYLISMERRDFDYDEVISKDNLMLAWDHVRYDANDDYSPDVLVVS
jgi:hypothetical protein